MQPSNPATVFPQALRSRQATIPTVPDPQKDRGNRDLQPKALRLRLRIRSAAVQPRLAQASPQKFWMMMTCSWKVCGTSIHRWDMRS